MKIPLKAIILDDLPLSIETLTTLLQNEHPDIEIAGVFEKAGEALLCITEKSPDIIFLDIEMPERDGFQFFASLKKISIPILCVIVTAHLPKYISSLLDNELVLCLEKPVSSTELSLILEKARMKIDNGQYNNQPISSNAPGNATEKIALNTVKGLLYITAEELIYAKADRKCTDVWINGIGQVKLTKGISDLHKQLNAPSIYKPDKSWLINLKYLKQIHEYSDRIILTGDNNISYEITITNEGLANLKAFIKKMRK